MESLLPSLQSSDVKVRTGAVEAVLERLQRNNRLPDVPGDVKFKIMSACVHLMKDANPQLSQLSLDCVHIFAETASRAPGPSAFAPLYNTTFDILLNKFSDLKQNVRVRSMEVALVLIDMMGLSVGLEKLLPHLTHRNWRIREQVLCCIQTLISKHKEGILVVPDIGKRVSILLQDAQESVRQVTMEVLAELFPICGERLADDLAECGVRPAQIKQLRQFASGFFQTLSEPAGDPTSSRSIQNESMAAPVPGVIKAPVKVGLQRAVSDPVRSEAVDVSNDVGTAPVKKATVSSARASLAATAPARGIVRQASAGLEVESAESLPPVPLNLNSGSNRKYSPDYFFSILVDGSPVPVLSTPIYTEKDLADAFSAVQEGLAKPAELWEERIAALAKVQSLVCGNALSYDNFPALLRGLQELLPSQITDLRSTVSKEGCRTAAILANRMGNSFGQFAELWLVFVLKIIPVKIQVISIAADRAARCFIYCLAPGHARLVPTMLEQCANKNAAIRKVAFDCLNIALARWKIESLDKNFSGIRQLVSSGVGDADANVRKAARLMFWIIKRRGGSWSSAMDALHSTFDDSTKKHVKNEAESSFEDLTDLFRKPDAVFPIEKYFVAASGADENTTSHASSRPPTRAAVAKRSEDAIARAASSDDAPIRSSSDSLRLPPRQEVADPEVFIATHHTAMSSALSGGAARASALTGPSRQSIAKAATITNATSLSNSSSGPDTNTADSKSMALAAARELRESRNSVKKPTATEPTAPQTTGALSSTSAAARRTLSSSSAKEDRGYESTAGATKLVGLANGPVRISRPAAVAKSSDAPGPEAMAKTTSSINGRLRSFDAVSSSLQDSTSNLHDIVTSGAADDAQIDRNHEPTDGNVDIIVEKVHACASTNELRAMIADPLWDIRLKALLQIRWRVSQAMPPAYFKDDEFIGPSKKGPRIYKDASEQQLSQDFIDIALDLAASRMNDPHIRVQTASLECILLMIYPIEYTSVDGRSELYVDPLLSASLASGKLGYLLPALFARLADRRPKIRDQANEILNHIKTSYDPNIIMSSLSPRLSEVTDRIRTAVVQFLQPIVPLCEKFFVVPANTHTFLNRMAYLLGSGGINKPSTAFVLSTKRILELVYKVCPQMVLAQIGNLSLQDQQVIKKQFQGVVVNIDNAVFAASKAEAQRIASEARVKRHHAAQESKESVVLTSLSLSSSIPVPPAVSEETMEMSASIGSLAPADTMESSMYDVGIAESTVQDDEATSAAAASQNLDESLDSVERVFQEMKSRLSTPRTSLPKSTLSPSHSFDFADVDGADGLYSSTISRDTLERSLGLQPAASTPAAAPKEKTPRSSLSLSRIDSFTLPRPPTPGETVTASPTNTNSPIVSSPTRTTPRSIVRVSPISHQNKDVVWLLRCLGGSNFVEAREERTEAITLLKAMIKDESAAFWERNFAQIVSLLLDAFTPMGVTETLYASAAAAGEGSTEELERIQATAGGNYAVGGATNGLTGYSPLQGRVLQLAAENNPDSINREGANMSPGKPDAIPSSGVTAATPAHNTNASASTAEETARIARMEYLHQVCRLLLLIVRHRGRMLLNFLELLCCRLCEAAAFAPLAITMHCEQILAAACTLDPVSMARALAPYTHYGSTLEPTSDSTATKLPAATDASGAPSPTSYVRLLALRVLAQCISHLTSPELIGALPMITACVMPSFRSSLVDMRQAVVQVLVNAYVLVGDVLYPYIKDLPPQQKKLLTIYIERQMMKAREIQKSGIQ